MEDQAERLRRLVENRIEERPAGGRNPVQQKPQAAPRVIAVTSGKGGDIIIEKAVVSQ